MADTGSILINRQERREWHRLIFYSAREPRHQEARIITVWPGLNFSDSED